MLSAIIWRGLFSLLTGLDLESKTKKKQSTLEWVAFLDARFGISLIFSNSLLDYPLANK